MQINSTPGRYRPRNAEVRRDVSRRPAVVPFAVIELPLPGVGVLFAERRSLLKYAGKVSQVGYVTKLIPISANSRVRHTFGIEHSYFRLQLPIDSGPKTAINSAACVVLHSRSRFSCEIEKVLKKSQ